MFDELTIPDARPIAVLKRGIWIFLLACLPTAVCSGYRAYYQVRGLELRSADEVVRAGSVIEATVVSSGRTDVDVRIELVQGAKRVTLGAEHVPGNAWASIDPRSPRATLRAVVRGEDLAQFDAGEGVVRATAVGRPQWLRLPPPTVTETVAHIRPADE